MLERLVRATHKTVANPEFAQKLYSGGADPVASRPEEFLKQLQGELGFWAQVAKANPALVTGGK